MSSSHCAPCLSEAHFYSSYLFVLEEMPDLLDQINEAEGRLQSLLNGEGELTSKRVIYRIIDPQQATHSPH